MKCLKHISKERNRKLKKYEFFYFAKIYVRCCCWFCNPKIDKANNWPIITQSEVKVETKEKKITNVPN